MKWLVSKAIHSVNNGQLKELTDKKPQLIIYIHTNFQITLLRLDGLLSTPQYNLTIVKHKVGRINTLKL